MIKISPEALEETNKLSERTINNNPTDWQSDDSKFVRIAALNTRSLNKHFSDILCDFTLLKSDFLCLSETWIENHNDIKTLKDFPAILVDREEERVLQSTHAKNTTCYIQMLLRILNIKYYIWSLFLLTLHISINKVLF